MAINTIKSYPVLPVRSVQQKEPHQGKHQQKEKQEKEDEERKINPQGNEDGHIDEFA